jgi:hypothetical protein
MSNDHTARPESWGHMTQMTDNYWADCLLEIRARVERLEHKQRDSEAASQVEPAPSTPAGQRELVRRVLNAMLDVPNNSDVVASSFEARAAILAVILWLESQAWRGAADALRREVRR